MTQEKEKRTEKEWQETLTSEQYRILREKGTERAFTGEYDKYFEKGTYTCAGCSTPLFESETKYDSGCGWPAFISPFRRPSMKLPITALAGCVPKLRAANVMGT